MGFVTLSLKVATDIPRLRSNELLAVFMGSFNCVNIATFTTQFIAKQKPLDAVLGIASAVCLIFAIWFWRYTRKLRKRFENIVSLMTRFLDAENQSQQDALSEQIDAAFASLNK